MSVRIWPGGRADIRQNLSPTSMISKNPQQVCDDPLTLSRRSPIICTRCEDSKPALGSSIRTTRSMSMSALAQNRRHRETNELTGIPQTERVTTTPKTQQPGTGLNSLDQLFYQSSDPTYLISRMSCLKTTIFAGYTHSSFTVSSSVVGRRGRTKEKRDDERSLRNRLCRTPGCMVDEFPRGSGVDYSVSEHQKGSLSQAVAFEG